MYRVLMTTLLCGTIGTAALVGCDKTVEEKKTVEQKRDGTVVEKSNSTTQKPDGTVVEKSADFPAALRAWRRFWRSSME